MFRTHDCNSLRKSDIGRQVTLAGWVNVTRDHGGVVFIDLRDREGLTQIVFRPEENAELAKEAHSLRSEDVIEVSGRVAARLPGTENPNLATGDMEVIPNQLRILNRADTLPFPIDAEPQNEDLRMRYRYFDLRRPRLARNLRVRHRVAKATRDYLDTQGFVEVETPILSKSTPEGARDFLVPSRITPGKFYALPQAPQQYKQLLMVAGVEKYFQIAKCFRDEDLRADRQPEFSQLDVEMSFATPEQIYRLVEGLFARIFRLIDVELETPFPRLTFAEAMRRFGSDKPDLRIPAMELQDLSDALAEATFAPYASILSAKGEIRGVVVSGGASMSRKTLDELQDFAKRYGATALAWIKLGDELTSSLLKVLGHDKVVDLAGLAGAQKGDAVLIVAGKPGVVAASLGALRNEVAKRENLIPEGVYAPLWVTEFPMFEYHEDDGRHYAMHHPFTSPLDEDVTVLERAVNGDSELFGQLRAKAYDTVINGVEVAGGSIRIHRSDVQSLVFKALGMTEEQARARFGFFLEALTYGTPPHGGIASGIERTLMVLVPTENIREVMAFPKTASAQDLMIDAPGEVDPKQLDELHLKVLD